MTHERYVVKARESKPMTAIQGRTGFVRGQVLEVLGTPRRQPRSKEVGGAVIDQVTPGVSGLKIQPVGETLIKLQGQAMIARVADRRELHDVGREAGRQELRCDSRSGLDRS